MKWIKCTDKLPALAEDVLVSYNNTIRLATFSPGIHDKYQDKHECLFIDMSLFWRLCGITHWMPLPELPLDANKE
jgi:Protein of unknown function (DUF551)